MESYEEPILEINSFALGETIKGQRSNTTTVTNTASSHSGEEDDDDV